MPIEPSRSVPPTRIALAGFGAWAQLHVRAIAAIDGAEIVAVLARSAAAREAAARILPQARLYDDYAAMLADRGIDVVNIVLPNNVHADAAVAAVEAGKNVLLEKPLGLTLAQCDAVAAAAKRHGQWVAVNHELRVSRQWGAVHEMVARGELGPLRHQHLSLFRRPFRSGSGGWRYDRERVGSWVLEELVHFIDLILWYAEAGGLPARVTAYGGDPESGLSGHFSTVLEWDDGATAILNQCLSGFEHHTLLEISGTGGALRTWWSGTMDRTETPSFEMKRRRGDGEVETIDIPLSGEVFELEENLRRAYAGFSEGYSVMPPERARVSVAVCLAAEQSWRECRSVQLTADQG